MDGATTTLEGVPEVLARADALAAEGRSLDAIALLIEANRRARSTKLEQRIVTLRHEAFAGLPRHPLADLPPSVTADPPHPGPLREFTPADLDVATFRSSLAEHGCMLIRGLLSPERAGAMADRIDLALAACDESAAAHPKGMPNRGVPPWYVPFRSSDPAVKVGNRRSWFRASGSVLAADSPRVHFDLLDEVVATGVATTIAEHFGERPALSVDKSTLRRVPVDANTAWHQDGAFLGESVRSVNLWIALTACDGVTAPGLEIVPRRLDRVVQAGTGDAFFDWSVGSEVVAEVAGDVPLLRPAFQPGDAMLFDHLFLHRTAIGPAVVQERHAIEMWFFSPSAYPDGQIPLVL